MATKRIGNITLNYTVPEAQTQVYNAIGRTAGAQVADQQNANQNQNGGDNFFVKRGKSIENAIGTTLATPVAFMNDRIENDRIERDRKDVRKSMNELAKKYGYDSWDAWQDAYATANETGDKAKVAEMKKQQAEFKALANSNANKATEAANKYSDYRQNDYISNKINQDRGKFAGSAINTLSTAADITGITSTPGLNAVQGAVEGFADELEQNGGLNSENIADWFGENGVNWQQAGQNALIGATTGAVTGALNKGISNSLAKRAAAKGLTNAATKTGLGQAIKQGAKTIAGGAARGALSGAVGGATGAGLQSALNGVEFGQGVQNALQGAVQGAQQGAITGGTMAAANMAISKTPGLGKFYNDLQNARQNWEQSGKNFDERLTNTINSGDSRFGNWLNKKNQSKLLGAMGNLGNSVRPIDPYYRDLKTQMFTTKEGTEIPLYIRNWETPEEVWRNFVDSPEGARYKNETFMGASEISAPQTEPKYVGDQQTKFFITKEGSEVPLTVKSWETPEEVWRDFVNSPEGSSYKNETLDNSYTRKGVQQYYDKQRQLDNALRQNNVTAEDIPADIKQLYDDGYITAGEMVTLSQKAQTPTTAKGWAKKAGQRIVEDINNSNLGNRVKDVSSDMPEDIRNMQIRDYNVDEFDDGTVGVNVNNTVNYGRQMAEFAGLDPDKVSELAYADLQNRGINSDNLAEGQWAKEIETSFNNVINQNRQPVMTAQATQATSAWDRVAQEAGYRNYDEVLQRYAEANPNAKINPRGMAGQVLTWMDQNPNTETPTTAAGWAKRAGQRAIEDINKRGIGLSVQDVSAAEDPSKRLYNALAGNQGPTVETEAEVETDAGLLPSKTSKETKLRYAKGKELLAQYGAVDQPMARATNAAETFQEISDMGFSKPAEVEAISNAITGANGAVSKLNKSIIESAQPVDTFSGDGEHGQTLDDFIDYSIEKNKLGGTSDGVAIKRSINAYLRSLPSRAEGSIDYNDSASDTFKVIQGLEKSAAESEGRGGSTYHRPKQVDLNQAAVMKDVAGLLKERLYNGADVETALTPEVAQSLKAYDPENKQWANTVDNFVATAKTPQDLRTFQKPFVRASRYIDNQYIQAATVGGRMAANAGELPSVLPVTKAGWAKQIVNDVWNSNLAHRARAAMYGKLADKAAAQNNAQVEKTPTVDTGNAAANPSATSPTQNNSTAKQVWEFMSTPDSNPSTRLYNAIGRTEGLTNAEQANTAKYLVDAVQEAEVVPSMDMPVANQTSTIAETPTYGSTQLYNTVAGTPSATTQTTSTGTTGYFEPTGDYWTDVLARAISSAIDANDVDAFASLYEMYQDAIAQASKQSATSSNSQQKLTTTQQRANAAMNSLERLSNMTPDTAYNLSNIPVIGNIATWGGNDYESEAKSLAQQIGYMVSGSNIKDTEAENIGKSYVPQPWDNEQVRQNKLRRAYDIIQQYQNGYAEA